MKKSELQQIIKEELSKRLPINKEESFVITNGKEWYAGLKDYIVFAKHNSQSNLYSTYSSAQKVLFDEIPDNVVKEKQLKIKRFS